MSAALKVEWEALLARRRKFNASGQGGSDLATWLKFLGVAKATTQLELFA